MNLPGETSSLPPETGPSHVLLFGLGAMGMPIARRLLAAGFTVAGFDPHAAARQQLAATGATALPCTTPGDALRTTLAASSHAVGWALVSCVTDAAALAAIWFGEDGLAQAVADVAGSGLAVIDHTTTDVALARRIAGCCAEQGAHAVDAPLSGGVRGAILGTLSAMLGGTPQAVRVATPVLGAYCATSVHLGEAGAGQAGKLANQLAIAGTNLGLFAATRFARGAGLDTTAWLQALAAGSAHSAQLVQHHVALAGHQGDLLALFGWLQKDMQLARTEAASMDSATRAAVDRLCLAFAPEAA